MGPVELQNDYQIHQNQVHQEHHVLGGNSCEITSPLLNDCKECGSKNIIEINYDYVCYECGLVQKNSVPLSSYSNTDTHNPGGNYEIDTTITHRIQSAPNNKLQQMQQWYMWSNEEKNAHKLTSYTKSLCSRLEIPEQLVKAVCDTVVIVMTTIKKYDGTKRARVKDGIILCCAQYACKGMDQNISAVELAKRINLDVKYVTKADKLILELMNSKKLNLDRHIILQTQTPYEHVLDVIQKQGLQIPNYVLNKIQRLIKFCDDNDILLDHTPLSIGVCCFYYILMTHQINVDIKMFSELYDLSVVTVLKTFNKLKQYAIHIATIVESECPTN